MTFGSKKTIINPQVVSNKVESKPLVTSENLRIIRVPTREPKLKLKLLDYITIGNSIALVGIILKLFFFI